MKILLAIFILVIWVSPVFAQTISESDIDYFVGYYARTNVDTRNDIDFSELLDWEIAKPSRDLIRVELDKKLPSVTRHWVYRGLFTPDQRSEILPTTNRPFYLSKLRYFIFKCMSSEPF